MVHDLPNGRAGVLLAVIASMLGGLAAGCGAAPAGAVKAAYASAECRFLVPDDLGSGAASWVGACRDGHAEGLGVVRVAYGDEVHLFAGRLSRGRPVAGFLDTGSADTTGSSVRFSGSRGLPPSGRGEVQRGCTVAAEAAEAASTRYARVGNGASARFYANWARTLKGCMAAGGE